MCNIYFKKSLGWEESGVASIHTEVFRSIHESELVDFCVRDFQYESVRNVMEETGYGPLQIYKRYPWIMVKRIYKNGSRFAFRDQKEALNHLLFLKRRHLSHLQTSVKLVSHFIKGYEKGLITENTVDLDVWYQLGEPDELDRLKAENQRLREIIDALDK